MAFVSQNPANGEVLASYENWDEAQIDSALASAANAAGEWSARPLEARCELLRKAADVIRGRREGLAKLATLFTSYEYFWLYLLGLSCAVIVSPGSISVSVQLAVVLSSVIVGDSSVTLPVLVRSYS